VCVAVTVLSELGQYRPGHTRSRGWRPVVAVTEGGWQAAGGEKAALMLRSINSAEMQS
jgi:hypothetical protein